PEGEVDHGVGAPCREHQAQDADDQVPAPAVLAPPAFALALELVADVLKHGLPAVVVLVMAGHPGRGTPKGGKSTVSDGGSPRWAAARPAGGPLRAARGRPAGAGSPWRAARS